MLSFIDLIERKTITVELASYLLSSILDGSSILIGALSGGAGKTALMGALLGLLSQNERIITIKDKDYLSKIKNKNTLDKITYIVHEIGTGNWFGYLWGPPIKEFIELKIENKRIISNLHPDTIEDVKTTFLDFGVDEKLLCNFDLIIFIDYNYKKNQRIVREVWESDYKLNKFNLVYDIRNGLQKDKNSLRYYGSEKEMRDLEKLLSNCLNKNMKTIPEVNNYIYTNLNKF